MRVRASIRARGSLVALLALAGLAVLPCRAGASVEADIQAVVESGRHPWLRRAELADCSAALHALYAEAWAPLWIGAQGVGSQGRALVAALAQAGSSGLDPRDYDAPRLADRLASLDDERGASDVDRALLDVALSVGALRYVSDLRVGRVPPEEGGFRSDLGVRRLDLAALVSELARAEPADSVASRIEAIEPPYRRYRLLKTALARYRALAADASLAQPLHAVRKLVRGDRYDDAPALRHRLVAFGDLAADAPPPGDPHIYGATLAAALARFQARHGLDADGVVGPATFAALGTPLSWRVRQIELALERWRWLPELGPARIGVNVPEFALYAVQRDRAGLSGEDLLKMKVIVGRAFRTETPSFAGAMSEIVFRPYWNVPRSIARAEIVPKARHDPGFLARGDYELVDASGAIQPATPAMIAALAAGSLRVRQRPGPKNALGLVKFLFPNRYDVYLHGTPATGLFAQRRRDFSHGCIRVEDPIALAEWLLRGDPAWTRDRIVAAMNGDETVVVRLDPRVPVFIVYATAIAEDDGSVRFFDDLYGLDARLAELLAAERPGAS